MKQIIITLTAVLLLVSATAFAGNGEEKISRTIRENFQKEFKGATNVKWKESGDVVKASFTLNEFHVEAYFTSEGDLIGSARTVLYNQLPLAVIKKIAERYDNATVYEIIEFVVHDETFYCMTVDTETKKVQVKISNYGDLTVMKKIKK